MNKTIIAIITLIIIIPLQAQDIINKLGGSSDAETYDVTDSADKVLFRVQGDGGALFTGTYGSGTIPATGAGTRMMWYPKKAAFRAGRIAYTQWNDTNIGDYSVAMGNHTMASGETSTAMGWGTEAIGDYSTAMGYNTTASGVLSTAMGNYASTNGKAGSFIIADASGTFDDITLSSAINQMTMRFIGGYRLFTNDDAPNIGVTLAGGANSWVSVSDSTKKENYQKANGQSFLNSIAKLRLGSWNYKSQSPQDFRHYGPMAQEIFHYFGKDDFGTIGNDTTLATADMDGIMMIALQALEKRTTYLINENDELKIHIEEMVARIEKLENQ